MKPLPQFKVLKTKLRQLFAWVRKHPLLTMAYGFLFGVVSILLLFLCTYWGAFGPIPKEAELRSLKNPVTSTLYGSDEKPLAYYYLQNRSNIDSTELNPFLINALIATEDARFYTHSGIDYRSYGRVLVKSILMGQGTGGGSTINQQIAKNLFGRKKQFFLSTPINKIREIIIAKRLENIYSKEELLLLYFNTVSFGENLYGVEMASERFFSKSPKALSVSESATLVGLLKAPTYYNPRVHPERAETRRNLVLSQMVKYGYLSAADAETAKTPLELHYRPAEKTSSLTGYYKDIVAEEFAQWAEANPTEDGQVLTVERDGLHIYTTLDPYVQKYIEQAMNRQIERLQKLMKTNWTSASTEGGKDVLLEKLINDLPLVKNLKGQGKSKAQIDEIVSAQKPRTYWEIGKGFNERQQSLRDSVVDAIIRLHTGMVVMNSRTGNIMGYLGGIDYGFSQTDHIQTPKQVGSTFKPITYLTALESGEEPCNFYDNRLLTYSKYENWQPRNSNNTYGGSYSLHGALANSVNTVSVALQLKMGNERVTNMAEKMGIGTTIPQVPSMVLGTAEISLFEMVKAYASISNGGRALKPHIIARIEDQNGTVLYTAKSSSGPRVASENNVKALQQMMHGVLTEGTGSGFAAYEIPFNIIGKTGTTQNNGDGWFIGCSPELVIGAWVGTLDKRVQLGRGSGAQTAMPLVASVFKSLSSWKNPMLSNFEFENRYFPCPAYVESEATEAFELFQNDSTYIQQMQFRDSLELSRSMELDSLQSGKIVIPDSLGIQIPTDSMLPVKDSIL
ncbi:MAG: transglycosylase domain-containing protein [Maribacter sp.]